MAEPSTIVTDLSAALTTLESALQPLLAAPYEEVSSAPGVDPLQKAKLDVIVGYVVHDLIWIYLRTSGVDPATHPVMQELDRLKKYFDKIHSTSTKKDGPRFTIDKAAAGRFIAAAINSGRSKVDPSYTPTNAEAGPSTHTRFEEKEDVKRLLMESDEEVEADKAGEEKEEEIEVVEESSSKPSGKSKRPKMDPFAGYDQPKPKDSPSKKAKREPAAAPEAVPVVEAEPAGEPALTKKQLKKLAKKAAKAASS